MKLAYLIPEFPGQTHVFFWREVCALQNQGVEVRLVSTRRGTSPCHHDFAEQAARETLYLYPLTLRDYLQFVFSLRSWVLALLYLIRLRETSFKQRVRLSGMACCASLLSRWLIRNKIEHLHLHSCGDAAHVAAMAHQMSGINYSLTLHGNLCVYGEDHRNKMRDAAFVAAVGRHLVDELTDQAAVPPEKILVTCMGLDTSKHAPVERAKRHADGPMKMVTVARLNPGKGHLYALRAMRMAIDKGCNVEYLLIGGEENGYAKRLLAEIETLGLSGKVQLGGTRGEDFVLQILQESDLFVLPSTGLGEAWPVSVMEAMSCGLPVISTRIGSTPDMIDDGADGLLVEQMDVSALSDAIIYLYRNPAMRTQMGGAARRRAVAQFDVTHTARLLLDRIASRNSRTPIAQV